MTPRPDRVRVVAALVNVQRTPGWNSQERRVLSGGVPAYLVAIRGSGSYADCWEFPGGKLEGNETIIEAARRELREELDVESAPTGAPAFPTLTLTTRTGLLFDITLLPMRIEGEPRRSTQRYVGWATLEALTAFPITQMTPAMPHFLNLLRAHQIGHNSRSTP